MFVKPFFWILRDTVTGESVETATQLWHYYEGTVKPINEARTAWRTDFPDSNLLLISKGGGGTSATVYSGQKEPFIAGWHCPCYDQIRPAPELRIEQAGSERIVFHTLLMPVDGRGGEIPEFSYQNNEYTICTEAGKWRVAAPEEGDWEYVS
jgi:hypothetical protein